MKNIFWAIVLIGLLSGCASTPDLSRFFFDSDANVVGVGTNIDATFEEINLAKLLDPNTRGTYPADITEGEKIDIAFNVFFKDYPPATLKQRRNAVQEHLLAASTQRCNYFKHKLHYKRSVSNFSFGSLATVAGAAGAVVTGVDGSRVLSAIAAIFSGVRAEYNQELFSNLATQIIVGGIDLRRREVYNEIVLQGQAKSYDLYNIEASVKDAIYYHGQCNVIVGLEVSGKTLDRADNPGIDEMNRILAKLSVTNKLLQDDKLSPQEKVEVFTGTTRLLRVGTPLNIGENRSDPLVALSAGILNLTQRSNHLIAFVSDAGDTFTPNQKKALTDAINSAHSHTTLRFQKCQAAATQKTQDLATKKVEYRSAMLGQQSESAAQINARFKQESAEVAANAVSSEIQRMVTLFKLYLTDAQVLLNKQPIAQSDVDLARSKIGEINKKVKENKTICL